MDLHLLKLIQNYFETLDATRESLMKVPDPSQNDLTERVRRLMARSRAEAELRGYAKACVEANVLEIGKD